MDYAVFDSWLEEKGLGGAFEDARSALADSGEEITDPEEALLSIAGDLGYDESAYLEEAREKKRQLIMEEQAQINREKAEAFLNGLEEKANAQEQDEPVLGGTICSSAMMEQCACLTLYECWTALIHPSRKVEDSACWSDYMCAIIYHHEYGH